MIGTRKSNLLGKITVLLVICCCCLPAHAKYGGGTGESNDPYLIYTAEQMNEIGLSANSDDWDKHFKLMADIDLSAFTGTSFNIIGSSRSKAFTGVFYGDNHTISNFTYDSIDAGHLGVFGFVGNSQSDGEINNLGLVGPNVNTVKGHYVGTLVGHLIDGKINNCYVKDGSVTGDGEVGGLVGDNYKGRITNCYSTCSITGNKYVGGLVGHSYEGTITNCYSTGSVTGDNRVGGLMGFSHEGTITNCYSTGSVTGTAYVGGLLGKSSGHVVTSYWDIETSGQITSDGGTGLPTAQMQMASTFLVWACDNSSVWTIDEGQDYPHLWWENESGELITIPSYGGGNGEPEDPYLIYTAEQFNTIGLMHCHWDKHFKLMADIDLSVFTGTSFNIIGYWRSFDDEKPFKGVFDGSGHTISNFTYISTDTAYLGLFGYVSGEIKNLGLIEPNVDVVRCIRVGSLVGILDEGAIRNCYADGGSVVGYGDVGGLVGINYYGTIVDCNSSSSVSGDLMVGGLVGYNTGTITNCYSSGSVSGSYAVGGLVGYSSKGTITNCYSTGGASGDEHVGGLVGSNGYNNTISNSYSTGSVSSFAMSLDSFVGGLVGRNAGTITNCYAKGTVSGQYRVGGLVGQNGAFLHIGLVGQWYPGTISNCYATGSVTGEGLVGFNEEGEITDSFWDIETTGQTTSDGGTGKTTAEMQTMSTFTDAGWDFVGETFNGIEDIWFIGQQDYPHLWWEGMKVPMKLNPRTLNCRSKGKWVKAHLTLPQGFTVSDVDADGPTVLHSFGFESAPLYVFVNDNGLVQIEAAFERQAVCSLAGDWPQELTVAGFLADGNIFLGTSKVRIIAPGSK